MKKIAIPLVIVCLCLCGCNERIESPADNPAGPGVYQVMIPASMPGTRAVTFDGTTSTGTFKTTETVHVYNIAKKKLLSSTLSPSQDGVTCNLIGTFGTDEVSNGDALMLIYNANSVDIPYHCRFNYANQNGTPEGVIDGATASVSANISEGKVTTKDAKFENEQSMFRFRFSDGTNNISVSRLLIQSNNNALDYMNEPVYESEDYSRAADDIRVTPDSPTSDYLYVALCIRETKAAGDILSFIVTDDDGRVYKGTKAAPDGGFKNGKYYYNSTPIQLSYQYTKTQPTITWSSVKDGQAVVPDEKDRYNIYGPGGNGPIDISISSNSDGYQFWFNNDATVHISGNIGLKWGNVSHCFYATGALTLDINGDNTIHCLGYDSCVYGKPLKLKGNGYLTVFADNYAHCGLSSDPDYTLTNNYQATTEQLDVTAILAAEGYTVTRSARMDNGAGIYYWTYIVKPKTT